MSEADPSSGPGRLLRHHRRNAGLGQPALAERAGVSVRTLRDIERGRVIRPREESVHRLLAALPLTGPERAALLDAFGVHRGRSPARSRPGLHIGVLGPLQVRRRDRPVAVDQAMPRTLLSLLALRAGEPVPIPAAIDALWGDDPPKTCRNLIQVYIGRLRRLLTPDSTAALIRLETAGYVLDPAVATVDVLDFDSLMDQAVRTQAAGDRDAAAARYLDALRCWRGPVLDDADERLRHHPTAVRLAHRRVEAAIAHADLALAADRAAEVSGQLRELATTEPLHEGLHARLIRALTGAGEQAAALRTFSELSDRLADQLGVSPGPEVTAAYHQVLRVVSESSDVSQPTTVGTTSGPAMASPRTLPEPARPAQLPTGVSAFTGREAALHQLDRLLDRAGNGAPIAVVTGPGGVGKTALAVHWAHRAAGDFPDGQLYVNLRGFDASDEVVDPAEAIRGFLDALGVEAYRVPRGRDAQAALYRSLSASRRMLVVLDNARDADQVRPLLAAGPTTVITSRDRLTTLVAEVGAQPLVLDPPDRAEAVVLLNRRIGPHHRDAHAAAAIVATCGRLPLALALVAARARQTGFPLATLAAELRQPGLSALDDVRAVFSWSYRALKPAAARLFRLLGLAAGTDIATAAAAALAGDVLPDVRRALRELTDASLLTEHRPGRYQLHDLLRAYASELAHDIDTDADRRTALTRLLDHYTHTAYQADLVLNPTRAPIPMGLNQPTDGTKSSDVAGRDVSESSDVAGRDVSGPEEPLDVKYALQWLGTERAVLLSALRQAKDEGLDRHAWQLGWALHTFLNEHHHWHDEGAAWAVALSAATALVDRPAAAHAHRFLAVVASRLDRFSEAHAHMRRAAELSRTAGDRPGEAETQFVLSYVCWLQADRDRALDHAEQSLALWAELGHAAWEGKASNAVGWYHAQLGDHHKALRYYKRSLALYEQAADRANEVVARDNLGQSYHDLGLYETAAEHYRLGLRLTRALADPVMQAQLTSHLGDTYQAMGDNASAREHWQQAYELLTDVGHPQAADVRRKLNVVSPILGS